MKQGRHEKILELIIAQEISTQDELLSLLKNSGYDVTQATVSRDIKQLRLLKILSAEGKYIYSVGKTESNNLSSKFDKLLADSAIRIDYVCNQVIIKCYSGLANAVCAAFDSQDFEDIVGTLAGDDTILIILRSENGAEKLCSLLIKKCSAI
jgi:transcriptional regulator of arginine metabolism